MNNRKIDPNLPIQHIQGKWLVTETPDLDDDYLELTQDPHVVLKTRKSHNDISGDYAFGAQTGVIDGQLEMLSDGGIRLIFSFEGNDELDMVHGYGEATLVDEGTLKGYMRYHLGDTYRFVWKRVRK
ncbi:MAG: hypothetical protein A2158_08365 [Chloroflexi bacterium RBG_13_46_14]|nr:MAG: hypothetical protein A2158_08365 [Chloroflexi bacterium RBG_13_46_14]